MNQIVGDIDSFVWGPVMLCLLVVQEFTLRHT